MEDSKFCISLYLEVLSRILKGSYCVFPSDYSMKYSNILYENQVS